MTQTLFTEVRGYGSDLVLLHGWGLNSGVWEPISHKMQQDFRITLIDLPGFGRNAECLPDNYTLDEVTDMVAAVIPVEATVLGWSMGGLVAQNLAIRFPQLMKKLVLVATTPKFEMADDWPGIRPDVLNVFEQQLERNFSKTLDRFLAIQAMGSPSSKHDIKTIRHHVQRFPIPDEKALRAGLGLLSSVDLRTNVSELNVDTLRLYGRLDSLVPHSAVEKIQALQPDCQSHVFAHASHAPFISHIDEFYEVLKSFSSQR